MNPIFTFDAEPWLFHTGGWVFASLPIDISQEIRNMGRLPKKGFGSIRVEVTIGSSTWQTSIFPDSKLGTYVLPIKKDIRKNEKVAVGESITISLVTHE
jgi:Domain of unknown function (DUF1905)